VITHFHVLVHSHKNVVDVGDVIERTLTFLFHQPKGATLLCLGPDLRSQGYSFGFCLTSKVQELIQVLDHIRSSEAGWKKSSLDDLSEILDEVSLDKPIDRNVSSALMQQARSALLSMWYHLLHALGNGDEIDEYARHSATVLHTCYRYLKLCRFSPLSG
jgi:hypothetical protein